MPEPRKATGNTRELARKVSTHVGIRPDIVHDVIDGTIDIIVDEIMNNGELKIPGFIEITSYEHNKSTYGKSKRLKTSLSWKIRQLWKLMNNGKIDKPTKDTWRQLALDHVIPNTKQK